MIFSFTSLRNISSDDCLFHSTNKKVSVKERFELIRTFLDGRNYHYKNICTINNFNFILEEAVNERKISEIDKFNLNQFSLKHLGSSRNSYRKILTHLNKSNRSSIYLQNNAKANKDLLKIVESFNKLERSVKRYKDLIEDLRCSENRLSLKFIENINLLHTFYVIMNFSPSSSVKIKYFIETLINDFVVEDSHTDDEVDELRIYLEFLRAFKKLQKVFDGFVGKPGKFEEIFKELFTV